MPESPSTRMTFTLWAVCVIAAIGFAFDTYELLMLPLVARDALLQLGGPSFTPGSGSTGSSSPTPRCAS